MTDPALVVGFAGPAAELSGRAADALGVPHVLVPAGDVGGVREVVRSAGGPAVVVALPYEMTDALLTGLLGDLERALETAVPWERLPRWTLLTGRDHGTL